MLSKSVLVSDIVLPEVERQLLQDPALWPNVNGNEVQPIITSNVNKVRGLAKKKKIQTVKIRVEDSDLLNFITGGLTGIKAYVNRRIKIKGDLVLAQRLENLFEKAGGRERALEYIRNNEPFLLQANLGNAKL
ncbi:hypothetical protein BCR42DRAFT_323146 [Absidia repens]|uniref:SCP2 domain-containing protein n=1 Tax=Absidia repens TaxID=90262 RepID=A0A1X2IP48_9FUNG|nr:hypothetical protein BCR42DRAFT_323146 [Absidia repens]